MLHDRFAVAILRDSSGELRAEWGFSRGRQLQFCLIAVQRFRHFRRAGSRRISTTKIENPRRSGLRHVAGGCALSRLASASSSQRSSNLFFRYAIVRCATHLWRTSGNVGKDSCCVPCPENFPMEASNPEMSSRFWKYSSRLSGRCLDTTYANSSALHTRRLVRSVIAGGLRKAVMFCGHCVAAVLIEMAPRDLGHVVLSRASYQLSYVVDLVCRLASSECIALRNVSYDTSGVEQASVS